MTPRIFVVALLLMSVPSLAFGETIVRNDSVGENLDSRIGTAEIIPGEIYESTFDIPASWFDTAPNGQIEILGVRALFVNGQDANARHCGRFSVEIWEESTAAPVIEQACFEILGGTGHKEPGTRIFSLEALTNGVGFEVESNPNALQDLRFSVINSDPQLQITIPPITIARETRTIRVGLKALDLQCTQAGQKFPVIVTDTDGQQPETNFLYGREPTLCPTFNHYLWEDLGEFFSLGQGTVPGDWVIRLIVDRGDDTGDAGGDAGGGDVGVDMSSDSSTPDDTGSNPDAPAPDSGNGGPDGQTGALALVSVSPDQGPSDRSTDIAITGSGFEPGAEVLLGGTNIGVTSNAPGLIRATVPDGFDLGSYDIIVTNPDGATAVLTDAFEIVSGDPGETGSSGGCCATASTRQPFWFFAMIAMLGLIKRRRRSGQQ